MFAILAVVVSVVVEVEMVALEVVVMVMVMMMTTMMMIVMMMILMMIMTRSAMMMVMTDYSYQCSVPRPVSAVFSGEQPDAGSSCECCTSSRVQGHQKVKSTGPRTACWGYRTIRSVDPRDQRSRMRPSGSIE